MLEIEIVDSNIIEGGVEIFARAWRDGEQIGFGVDGTVDVERFRIINPPILVPDENGEILREWTDIDTGELQSRTLREDPEEAILQSLTHTIGITGKSGTTIVPGSVGNTTTTVYPAAGNTEPWDGMVRIQSANTTFSALNNQTTGQNAYATETVTMGIRIQSSTTSDQFAQIARGVFGFDTSAVGADSISSAVLSFYGNGSVLSALGHVDIEVVSHTPTSESSISTADYNYSKYGTTSLATAINTASFSTSGYNDFTLNASGQAYINGSGNTFFATFTAWEKADTFGGSWASSSSTQVNVYHADQTGTSSDPKLVIVHAAAASTSIKSVNGLAQASVKSVNGLAIASVKSVNGLSNVS